jgi:hypothetical protein
MLTAWLARSRVLEQHPEHACLSLFMQLMDGEEARGTYKDPLRGGS